MSTSTSTSASAPDAISTPVIETRRLTKWYGTTAAVHKLDLTIEKGEIFGLLGPNGAGKTTTILMLLGLTEPSEGTAVVDGLDPAHDALAIKRIVGYMPDDVGFYDDLTGRENLRYTARLNRVPRRSAEATISQLLHEVGLTDAADRRVGGYSRGMRQRLGLADALVKSPSVLVLDEPTVNIDPEGVRDLLALVRTIRDERGVTVLLSSHLLHQVEQVCDRIGIFVQGELVACGSVEKLAARVQRRWTIEVEVGGDAERDAAWLADVEGVDGLTREGSLWLVTSDHDVRDGLLDAAQARSERLVHLRRRGADLDAIYHRYFVGGDDVAA